MLLHLPRMEGFGTIEPIKNGRLWLVTALKHSATPSSPSSVTWPSSCGSH